MWYPGRDPGISSSSKTFPRLDIKQRIHGRPGFWPLVSLSATQDFRVNSGFCSCGDLASKLQFKSPAEMEKRSLPLTQSSQTDSCDFPVHFPGKTEGASLCLTQSWQS